jgi:hypothetical protein
VRFFRVSFSSFNVGIFAEAIFRRSLLRMVAVLGGFSGPQSYFAVCLAFAPRGNDFIVEIGSNGVVTDWRPGAIQVPEQHGAPPKMFPPLRLVAASKFLQVAKRMIFMSVLGLHPVGAGNVDQPRGVINVNCHPARHVCSVKRSPSERRVSPTY